MRAVLAVATLLVVIGAAPGAASAQVPEGCDVSDPLLLGGYDVVECAMLAAGCPTTAWELGRTTTCTVGPAVCVASRYSAPREGEQFWRCDVDTRAGTVGCGSGGSFGGSSDYFASENFTGCTVSARRVDVTAGCGEQRERYFPVNSYSQGCVAGPASVKCTERLEYGEVASDVCVVAVGEPDDPTVVCTIDRRAPEASGCTRP